MSVSIRVHRTAVNFKGGLLQLLDMDCHIVGQMFSDLWFPKHECLKKIRQWETIFDNSFEPKQTFSEQIQIMGNK